MEGSRVERSRQKDVLTIFSESVQWANFFIPDCDLILFHFALFTDSRGQKQTTTLGCEAAGSAVSCMSGMPIAGRPHCVLGTPACPQCKETGLESNGGFLTCSTCGMAITQQALLREIIDMRRAPEIP